ncbi:AAA ATPase [Rhizopus azygosporus]|uniref:Cell division control protein n=1 Tax=Rhizopus azygosporus TaxID=86630 RepID=A0A367IZ39_RHIAZ|nr:AAA ATPase [Rhizopus azygosporus]
MTNNKRKQVEIDENDGVPLKRKATEQQFNQSKTTKKDIQDKTNIYQSAKTVFRRAAVPSRLIGRGQERETISQFWRDHVLSNKPGCLYISGMPGTGKTAMLTEVMRTMENEIDQLDFTVKTVMINCMSMKEPKQIYVKLVESWKSTNAVIQADIIKQAHELMNAKKDVLNVVVLDEIDSLKTKEQDVLYKVFEWASLPNSRLVLIGIANALDLTDRILPRLRAKNCEPQLLNFNPYTVSEISCIIKDRLYSLVDNPTKDTPLPLFQPAAIELCSRKVAASMGDLRTALDICRQAVELAEMEQKKLILSDKNQNIPESKVTIGHVMKVLNVVFGNPTVQKLKQLSLPQKVVLVVFSIMQKSNKQITLGKFREQYSSIFTDNRDNLITGVSRTELNDLLSMLETASILSLGKNKEERARKIQLHAQENEIIQMVEDMPILKNWMIERLKERGLQ